MSVDAVPQVTPADYSGPSDFCHLHAHTIYSTLDGVALPSQYAARCQEMGYKAMAITEHGHMGSVPDAYAAFKAVGVKYIPAIELYFSDYEPERQKAGALSKPADDSPELLHYLDLTRSRHLTVLAKNEAGYVNLLKMSTQAYKTGFYRKPRVWFDKLLEFKEGLIILSGCLNGPICHELRLEKPRLQTPDGRGAIDWARRFKEAFGEDYYIELQMPGVEGDDAVFHKLVAIADHFKIKMVLTGDCHYTQQHEWDLQKVMMAIDQKTTIDSPDLFYSNSNEQYFKSRAELWARFYNYPYSQGIDVGVFERACDNTVAIADKCKAFKPDTSPKMPILENADSQLSRLVAERLVQRGLHKNDQKFRIDGRDVTYVEQTKIELERIIDKGFASYFLITKDLVDYGKGRGWSFGPRGSAGGSLVVHLLGISPAIDPMLWGLSFDRFLSPSRGGYLLDVRAPVE